MPVIWNTIIGKGKWYSLFAAASKLSCLCVFLAYIRSQIDLIVNVPLVMKVYYRHIDYEPAHSFAYYHKHFPQFDAPIHIHPEFELAYIMTTHGKLFVGNNISEYHGGELLLIGSNVPHSWRSEVNSSQEEAESMVLHFKEDFLGKDFFKRPEFSEIHEVLSKSVRGLLIEGKSKQRIISLLKSIDKEMDAFEQVVCVLRIMKLLSDCKEYHFLNEKPANTTNSHFDGERINKVFNYVMHNFKHEVRLQDVAEEVSMSPQAFCRYFKKVTRKTLVEILTEYRLSYACRLLRDTDKPVSEICHESGFRNISHFNFCFRQSLNSSPLKYRKAFLEQERLATHDALESFHMNEIA
jgi:AraC-like DNA-binding protein